MVLRFVGYAIPFLLVLYVLSIGPVVAILSDSNGSVINPEHHKLAISFYTPLIHVCRTNAWLGHSADLYIIFWRNLF